MPAFLYSGQCPEKKYYMVHIPSPGPYMINYNHHSKSPLHHRLFPLQLLLSLSSHCHFHHIHKKASQVPPRHWTPHKSPLHHRLFPHTPKLCRLKQSNFPNPHIVLHLQLPQYYQMIKSLSQLPTHKNFSFYAYATSSSSFTS